MEQQFNVGDVVSLNSSFDEMTVRSTSDTGIMCQWFEPSQGLFSPIGCGHVMKTNEFHPSMLTLRRSTTQRLENEG